MSGAERRRGGGRSVAVSIVVLVVAAMAAASAVLFVVTFNGPSPRTNPQPLARIVAALKSGRPPPGSGRDLLVSDGDSPPVPRPGDHPDAASASRLAALIGVPPKTVVALMPVNSGGPPDEVRGPFQVGWRRANGWRTVETSPDGLFTPWHRVTLAAIALALVFLSALAWFVARAISRPLRQVADAALATRAGGPLAPLPRGGASEVRDLSHAVETMHDRLQRHAEGRTIMLGAIAHDLGTPLSRLAFHVELLPEASRARAAADIDEMRRMIAATLALARDEGHRGEAVRIDLGSLLDSLIEDMAVAGSAVTLVAGPRTIVRGDPGALRRVFQNLIENAVRYGGAAAISWTVDATTVDVTVDDHGPGLGAADPERLFEPFVRGDPSRNRATGGTGLGLAIVRTLAERHGGVARLENGPAGGARATVTLPCA